MRLFTLATALLLCVPTTAFAQADLAAEPVVDGLDLPLYLGNAGDERLFVVEQSGRIRILADGAVSETPFLDLSGEISAGGERGLLGLAFHPDYAENGRFFVNYTDRDGDTQVVRYTVSEDPDVADPATATPILSVPQPAGNHNGGWLGFGPDGYLYIGMGDGGGAGDRQNNAQNADRLLGKILRIDVDGASPYAIPAENPFASGGGAPEIFALGARNPWRMAFDGDDLFIADVGQGAWEEVSVITTADAGANLGWRVMEGPDCYRAQTCDQSGLELPIHAYSHSEGGCSITGGYVYRGSELPDLAGHYFYADFCSGLVRSFRYENGEAVDLTDWTEVLGGNGAITSFGEDADGELYFTTIEGTLFRIAPAG